MSKIAQKSPIFPPPVYLAPPMKGLPLEFGIGVRDPECFYDGAIRWSKKFSDTFSRFDTIPAVTDSQPASHVAVAITLNAKASSLINTQTSHWQLSPNSTYTICCGFAVLNKLYNKSTANPQYLDMSRCCGVGGEGTRMQARFYGGLIGL